MGDQAEKLRKIMEVQSSQVKAPEASGTRIIAVTSGKGGVGKTNLSINIAIAYSRLGKKVLVLDADLGLANVNVMMGVIPKHNLYHVIRKQKEMKDIIVDTPYGVQIVAGASGFSRIANLSEDERQHFVDDFTTLSDADIIIIDTSAGVGSNVLAFVGAADDAVIVTTPEPTAITDAYGIIKTMSVEIDNLDMGIKLVVNRVSSVTEAKRVAQRVVDIAGQFLNVKLDYLGFVYEDPTVQAAVRKQQPFFVVDQYGRASQCIQHIVERLENVDFKRGGELPRFIRRLFGRI
ncbi:Flagellar synthesis regulator FleN [Olavius algarvensis spirochete endosymbiont]|uniref:MinD/ParA family protein n=1 Tax=Olavius algarvensis spirochete endosymbiont TaxID=260710 RepID=UPI000F2C891B|nr:MinD/ParA family protein [Olavius algarvensis spirochete endosymbiont]VDA99360.1 Flagellar synthesis regulator FleN [Olavius algarvensis spirochete endosymbiont]